LNIARNIQAQERIIKRFESRINKGNPDDCWEWIGRKDSNGYGRIDIDKKPKLAHRIAFKIANGFDCESVCHSCDNPPCCNPNHLWAGNPKLNAEDRDKKGRSKFLKPRKGSFNPASKLSEEQVKCILSSNEKGVELAIKYDVSKTAIYKIRNGENWAYLKGK
jgi:hypothetical protein